MSRIDIEPLQAYGHVILEFTKNGKLIYTIQEDNKEQKIFLTYRIQDDVLITDQPSKPREERTSFQLTPEGELLLCHEGKTSRYTRIKDRADAEYLH